MKRDEKRVDVICDLETLGTGYDATIIQIAAAAFNLTTGEIFETFNECVDITKGSINATGATIKWWLETNPELLKDILNRGTQSEAEVLKDFHDWLIPDDFLQNEGFQVYFWGNGILFDNAIIRSHFEAIGLDYPIFFRNDRDLRTLLELASMKSGIPEKEIRHSCYDESAPAHDAMNDVKSEIAWAHKCYKLITEV